MNLRTLHQFKVKGATPLDNLGEPGEYLIFYYIILKVKTVVRTVYETNHLGCD